MSDPCISTTGLPFVYDSPGEARDTIREVSSGTARVLKDQADESRFVGSEFSDAAKDRADQDRYRAGHDERLANDRHADTRWQAREFESVKHDVLRAEGRLVDSDRRTELAVEKNTAALNVAIQATAAATNLAIEKTAAATQLEIQKSSAAILLDAAKNAAAAALCCCELQGKIDASQAAILAQMNALRTSDLERQLTVFQIRAGTLASPA